MWSIFRMSQAASSQLKNSITQSLRTFLTTRNAVPNASRGAGLTANPTLAHLQRYSDLEGRHSRLKVDVEWHTMLQNCALRLHGEDAPVLPFFLNGEGVVSL